MRDKKYEDTMKALAISYLGMIITLIVAVLWS